MKYESYTEYLERQPLATPIVTTTKDGIQTGARCNVPYDTELVLYNTLG